MKELRWISILPIILGVIFIIYGWTQTWEYTYDGTNDYMFTIRMIRTYVFIVGGLILIFFGFLFKAVRKYIDELELRNYELKKEVDKK